MADNDILRRLLDAGVAFTQMTQQRAEAIVRELVRAGEMQNEQTQTAVQELLDRSRENTERLFDTVRTEMRNQIASLGLATSEDVESLRVEIRQSRPASRRTSTARRAPAATSPTKKARAAKSTATTSTTKRAPAAKSTATTSTAKRAPAAKSTAAKSTAAKSTARKSTAKKPTAKRAPATKSTAKRSTAKRATAKRATAKRATAKKATAKRATAKRATAKKATPGS